MSVGSLGRNAVSSSLRHSTVTDVVDRVVGPARRHDRRPQVRQARLGVVGPVAPGPRRRQARVELPARRLPRRDREALAPAPAVEHRRHRQAARPTSSASAWRPQPRARRPGRPARLNATPGAADGSSLEQLPSREHDLSFRSGREPASTPRPASFGARPSLSSPGHIAGVVINLAMSPTARIGNRPRRRCGKTRRSFRENPRRDLRRSGARGERLPHGIAVHLGRPRERSATVVVPVSRGDGPLAARRAAHAASGAGTRRGVASSR